MELRLLSSLEKVFADSEPTGRLCPDGTAWRNEMFAFQVAGNVDELNAYAVEISGDFPGKLCWREVMEIASDLTCFTGDDNYLRKAPGLYPDLLQPRTNSKVRWVPGHWQSIWVSAQVPADCPAGVYTITVKIGEKSVDFKLTVADETLAEFDLHHVEWFHTDCLARIYNVPVWSEEHWRIVENFARNAHAHKVTVLYTPLWTPPLDTAVGGERPTVQLLKITKDAAGDYHFDFSRLERWCRMAREIGFKELELSHFFTQWGAKATPKIVVNIDGKEETVFGWHVEATDPEYRRFLTALVPQLCAFFKRNGWDKRILCHISDEPTDAQLEDYAKARAILLPLVENDWMVIDALSHFEFYERGLIENPIPSVGVIDEFFGRVPQLWTYYCCGPDTETTNRFFAMPSARTRVMGVVAYVYNIVGFLHWGFNFYYSQYSYDLIDPFRVTDSNRAFPSGDAFLVYPGANGEAWDSIRSEVFHEGWQDLCALKRYEAKHGREATLALLNEGFDGPITAKHYPTDSDWFLSLRKRLSN